MDVQTPIISTILVSAIMVLTMAAMYAVSRKEAYLLDWMSAGLFFLLSNVLAILAINYQLPGSLHPAWGNAFYMAGHAAIFSGISRFLSNRSSWPLIGVVVLITLLMHQIPQLANSVDLRVFAFYPMIIVLNASSVFALWKRRHDDAGRAHWPLMAVLSFFVAQLIVRGVILLVDDGQLTFIGNDFMQTSGSLAVIGFLFLLTICFTIIVTWKKEVTLRRAAITDYLTGWLNRKALASIASGEFERSKRTSEPFGFILIDVDKFKRINDQYGHAIGDLALKHVSSLARRQIRGYDNHFRMGGEEFAVLVSDTQQSELTEIAERIRAAIERTRVKTKDRELEVTVSIGVALSTPSDARWESVLERADNALYQSKQNGRNLVTYETCSSSDCAMQIN